MTNANKPAPRPARPYFSSGPCAKRPGWSLDDLAGAAVGRSHRSKIGKQKLALCLDLTRDLLRLPEGYRIGVVPASDTGAVEMALWSLLGPRRVEVLVWESFGAGWATDIVKQLKLDGARVTEAAYGALPDLTAVDFARDVVFAWNGTTSGVRVPDGAWIPDDRDGLVICDATSAVFAQDLPWHKLDVATFSWQKVVGGEAAHGMLILGPRAVERLESHAPAWPLPKIFRLTKGGKLNEEIFSGATINTPSMLCVEDYLDALKWAKSIGGLGALMGRADANLAAIAEWVERSDWVGFLAERPEIRSNTSVCLKIIDPWFASQPAAGQKVITKEISTLLEREEVAFDIDGYRDAPPGLRIWAGATVDLTDIECLLPWLDWAYRSVRADKAALR